MLAQVSAFQALLSDVRASLCLTAAAVALLQGFAACGQLALNDCLFTSAEVVSAL
jgi:hypothetical protein